MWIQLENALINTNQVESIEPDPNQEGTIVIFVKSGNEYRESVPRWEELNMLSDREVLEMCKNADLAKIYAPDG